MKEYSKSSMEELDRRVDEVLFYVWDPIQINDDPFARWEYSNYVPKTLQLVMENDTPEPISAYLEEVVTEMMELAPCKEKSDFTARLLLRHRKVMEEGFF